MAVLAAMYLPDLGHGFIKDDFAWITGGRVEVGQSHLELFRRHNGFYRPLVSLSFALDEAIFGLEPFGYGLTNFVLVLAGAGSILLLGVALRMPLVWAGLAAVLWSLNPHGVGGSILWISGRTSLLLVVFATLAAAAFIRRKPWLSMALAAMAMLSKEEAVLLPVILLAWAGWEEDRSSWHARRALRQSWPLLLAWVVYFVLRLQTTAYFPWSAPTFYTPTLDPAKLARNVVEYADRAGTFALAVVIVVVLIVRRWPRPVVAEKGVMVRALIWIVGAYGLTVFLPVRSSLYALFPAVGFGLIGATLVACVWRLASLPQRRVAVAVALVLLAGLVPLNRSRNVRLARLAEFSSRALEAVAQEKAHLSGDHSLVLHDDLGSRTNLRDAFGTLIQDAVRLSTGIRAVRVWVEPPLPGAAEAGLSPPLAGAPRVELWLTNGSLQPMANRPPPNP